jgi:hypothetical protein
LANTLQDIAFAKLKAHYGGTTSSLNDYLKKFQDDNATFGPLLGSSTFYSKTSSESWNDAAIRYWAAYIP